MASAPSNSTFLEAKTILQDDTIREFATPRQEEHIEAVIKSMNWTEAAILVYGDAKGRTNLRNSIKSVIRKAEKRGYSPRHDFTKIVPDSHTVKGVSTLYNAEGDVSAQWVKTSRDKEDQKAAFEAFVEELIERIPTRPPIQTLGNEKQEGLLTVYPIADPHIGMYAWGEETGQSFDVGIASQILRNSMESLSASAPNSEQAIILNLGDFFHTDTAENRTRRSGNVLDVDTRWQKVMRVGANVMTDMIDIALRKHQKVTVRNCVGNHDEQSSVALALIIRAFYRNDPRVEVDTSPKHYWYAVFGKNLIGATHGHTSKPEQLGAIMAADEPECWGGTKHRYWYTGHVHNKQIIEIPGGVLVESFRAVAAKDSWTAAMGYRSGRDMVAITLDRDHGEVMRNRVDIRMAT